MPSAPIRRTAEDEEARVAAQTQRRRRARRQALASTRSPSVLSLACRRPTRPALPALPALPAPAPASVSVLAAGGVPYSFSEVSFETPGEGEGPPSVAPAPLRHRGNKNSSGVLAWYRGRSFAFWWPVVLAAALFLLCLLVAVVGAVNRRFEALAGRIAALELELGQPMLMDASAGRGVECECFMLPGFCFVILHKIRLAT